MLILVSSSNAFMVQGHKHISMKCLKSPIHSSWTTYVFKLDTCLVFCWAGMPNLILTAEKRNALDHHEEKQFPGQRD